jgi:hypothetical protein
MIPVLALLLGLTAGWCVGHSTARIRLVFIGATPAQDEAAIAADTAFMTEQRARFDAITAGFNDKDQAA